MTTHYGCSHSSYAQETPRRPFILRQGYSSWSTFPPQSLQSTPTFVTPTPHAMRNITPAARRDLLWWMTLLPQWSGVLLINSTRPKVTIHNDVSGVKGIGGWWDKLHAYSTRLPRDYRCKLIDWKEAYAILFAFAKWSHLWTGHTVLVMCDNTVVVNAINSRSVRGQTIDPLQLLFLTAALYDIEFRVDDSSIRPR